MALVRYLIQLLAVGGIYYAVARVMLDLAAAYPEASAIWPPAGFAFAAVVLGGYRVVPAIFAASLLANAWPDSWTLASVATAAGNALAALAAGFLINRWAEGRHVFAAPGATARFVLIAVVVTALCAAAGAAINAGVGVQITSLAPVGDWPRFTAIWRRWWIGDLAAVLLFTPVLVLWATSYPRSFALQPLVESIGVFAAAGLVGVLAFSPLLPDDPIRQVLGGLMALPLLWAALRRGPRDTATAGLILAGLAIWGTLLADGPLAPTLRGEPLLLLSFLIGTAAPGLTLAADARVRRRAERLLGNARQELDQARAQLAQAQKMEAVGQLTGGVAHDFNNLLTVILGNLDMAQRQIETWNDPAIDRLRRVINNAVRGAQRATAITQRLLVFSRKQPLETRALNINSLIDGMKDFLRRSLGETVGLEIIPSDGLWPVEVDPVQLEAALINLAVNARDAMAHGGRLTVETANAILDENYCSEHDDLVPGPYVQIAVRDTGAGMPRDVLERVFEPFFTTKRAGQGTGLGLSQVYGFVKQSGGHVDIHSRPGKGTIVTIYLPRLRGPAPDDAPPAPAAADHAPADTILLVEDDHDVRAYVVETLRELHYRVLDAHDGDAALAMVDRNDVRVDLLLTDVVLPGMNGRQLADELRTRQPAVQVLFMSGYPREAVVHQGRLDADVELMQKPLTQEILVQQVRAALDSARRARAALHG